jgi:ribose/xylose/arabinose/galactoside ABC-type transport system permease subunit
MASGTAPSFGWRFLQRTELGLLAAIALVVLLAGLLDSQHTYFTEFRQWLANPRRLPPSAVDILRQTALLGIFTLGAAIVIISGGIDLSSGSVIAFSGTICATIMLLLAPEEMKGVRDAQGNLLPIGLGTIAAAISGTLVVGLLIGSLHAWLITVVGLPPFVATLASLVGLRSLGRALIENVTAAASAKSTQIQIFDRQFRYLATSVWIPVVVFLVLSALAWLLMSRTVVGRRLHALGGNEQAARLSGIQTDRLKWLAYVLSALASSVAGVLYIGEEAVADPQRQGVGYELNAIAAAVVGGCSLQGGVGTIPGAVLGALFLRAVIDGVAKMIKTGADVYEGLIVGCVVVVAVALTQLRQAGRRGKQFFSGPLGAVAVVILSLLTGVLAMLFSQGGRLSPSSQAGGRWVGVVAALVALVVLSLAALLERRRNRVRLGQSAPAEEPTGR